MIITIYIDDLLIYNAKRQEIHKVKNVLKAKIYLSDLGPVSSYLKMALT